MWWEDFCDNAEVAATGEDITDAVEVLEPGLKSEHVWPIHGGLFELITPCFAFDITEQADCGLKRKKSIYLVYLRDCGTRPGTNNFGFWKEFFIFKKLTIDADDDWILEMVFALVVVVWTGEWHVARQCLLSCFS